MSPVDPKSVITPDAFTVAPELLGYALATPRRRLAAMLIDLAVGAIVAKAGLLLLIATGAALGGWRLVAGPVDRMFAGRSRSFFRVAGAVLAVIVFFNLRGVIMDRLQGGDEDEPGEVRIEGEAGELADDLELSGRDLAALTRYSIGMNTGGEGEQVGRAAEFGAWVKDLELSAEQRQEAVEGFAELVPEHARATYYSTAGITPAASAAEPLVRDTSVLAAFTVARQAGDTAALRALHPELVTAVAGEEISELESRNERLRAERDRLKNRVEELEERRGFVRATLASIMDVLGVTFSWYALYFTAFMVLGRGQTFGKRLMKIKVIRLDNRSMGWWNSFERFGCYGACIATGLLGFAQILWDRNRQGLHDKAMETVVIKLRDGQPVKLDWQAPEWMRPQPPAR